MAVTYIGAPYKLWNSLTQEYDTYYLITHANAVIETDSRKFIPKTLLDFIDELYDGGGTTVKYSELVTRVITAEGNIDSLESALDVLNAYFSEGESSAIIDNLQEILNFVQTANVNEGKSLREFIDDLMPNFTFNGTAVIYDGNVNFYAPTGAGNSGNILVSDGPNKSPKWQNYATLGNLTISGEFTLGSGAEVVGNIIPKVNESQDLGSTTKKWLNGYVKNIVASDIQTGTLKINNKTIDQHISANGIKSVVAKTTPPNASDYGRDSLVAGLVWIDTSGVPTGDTGGTVYSLKIKYNEIYNIHILLQNAIFGDDTSNISLLNENRDIPLITFDTALGLMALCITFDGRPSTEPYNERELRIWVRKWDSNNQNYSGEILGEVFSILAIYNSYEGKYNFQSGTGNGYDVVLPSGKILLNTENILTNFPKVYSLQIVGG